MFDNLKKSIKIKNYEVSNRMKYAATVNNFCDIKTGEVTDTEVAYLEERAKGKFGIVTSQGAFTHILGKGYKGQMGIHEESMLPGLKRIADAINKHGSMSLGQIMHTGRYAHPHDYGIDDLPRGPSDFTSPIKRYGKCKGMTKDEIHEQVEAHGRAARWFKEAGFDGVEICGIVGYLIADFLSSWTNLRDDEYGGSLENRARFFIEIIDICRKEVGPDYPLTIRLNSADFIKGGNSEDDYLEIAKMVHDKVDLISMTVGWHETSTSVITPDIEPGHWLYLPERWKKEGIKPPLCMAYRLNYPDLPDKAVADGIIDMWEVCRPGIADAFMAQKVLEDRPEDITVCPACDFGCFMKVFIDAKMACMVNPRCGNESDADYDIKPASRKKKVMVVGAGPSGMEVARLASIRGHDVTLYEKQDKLGGQVRLGVKTPITKDWRYMVTYYEAQMKKENVKVVTGKEVTTDIVDKESPDVLVIATGAHPLVPSVPGLDSPKVIDLYDVLDEKVEVGQKVVFWGSRELVVQTAEWLAEQGKDVTLVEEGKKIGRDINIFNILCHRTLLKKLNIKQLTEIKVNKITDQGLVITKEGKEETIPADSIIVVPKMESDNELLEDVSAVTDMEIHSVGDCVAPRKLFVAIHEGFKTGLKV